MQHHHFLHGIDYALGEEDRAHDTASGFGTFNIPNRPALWGWGQYRQATSSVFDLMIAAARRSMDAARIRPADIDCVVFCHATVPAYDGPPINAVRHMMNALGLERAFPVSVGLNGCAAMLSGVALADGLLAARRYKNVLVIAGDVHPADAPRFLRYAIFSDAACACVVSSQPRDGGYALVATATAADPATMAEDAGFSSQLALQTNQAMLTAAGLPASDIAKIFCNNIFLPITTMKETEGGFEAGQIYTDNVKRIGHCYSADALIGLADFARAGSVQRGAYFLGGADSPGLRAGVLLQAV